MTTDTAHSGIREIDTGALPDRYARGWHCLGPVKDYLDGKPHGVEIFGTMLVVFADSQGERQDSRRLLPAHGRQPVAGHHQGRRGGLPVPRLALGRRRQVQAGALRQAHAAAGPHPRLDHRRPRRAAVRLARPRGQPAASPRCGSPRSRSSPDDGWTDWRWNTMLIEGSNCREIIDNVTDMAHFFYIHFGLPTYFKNVFEGHIAVAVPAQRRSPGRERPGHLLRRGAPGLRGLATSGRRS